MNFEEKIRMASFSLIIASVVLVHLVRANPSADSKHNCKECPASRDNVKFNDTELERGNLYIFRVVGFVELVQLAFCRRKKLKHKNRMHPSLVSTT